MLKQKQLILKIIRQGCMSQKVDRVVLVVNTSLMTKSIVQALSSNSGMVPIDYPLPLTNTVVTGMSLETSKPMELPREYAKRGTREAGDWHLVKKPRQKINR